MRAEMNRDAAKPSFTLSAFFFLKFVEMMLSCVMCAARALQLLSKNGFLSLSPCLSLSLFLFVYFSLSLLLFPSMSVSPTILPKKRETVNFFSKNFLQNARNI